MVTPIRKPGKKKKSPMKRADELFSRYVRLRDRFCQGCGTPNDLQCAHLVTRAYKAVRHDPMNAVALCKGCHVRWTHRPLEWAEWCEERLGAAEWANLRKRALAGGKTDYKNLLGWLNEAIRTLEAEA